MPVPTGDYFRVNRQQCNGRNLSSSFIDVISMMPYKMTYIVHSRHDEKNHSFWWDQYMCPRKYSASNAFMAIISFD